MATSSLTLPSLQADSPAEKGGAATSQQTLTVLEGLGVIEPIHTLPSIEGEGGVLRGQDGDSRQSLGAITGQASASTSPSIGSEQTLGAPTAQAQALTQRQADSAQALEMATGEGSAIPSRLGTSEATLSAIGAQALAQSDAPERVASLQTLPLLTVTAEAASGRPAQSWAGLAHIVAQGMAHTQRIATSGQTLPVWHSTGEVAFSQSIGSILTLPRLSGSAWAGQSREGASELVLPLLQSGAAQAGGTLARSILALPVWIAQGTTELDALAAGQPVGAPPSAPNATWAVHAQTYAQSRDQGLHFNAVARLGTLFIGANEQGLYLLGAYTDDGAPIHALAQFPVPDDDGALLRRVDSLVLGYRSDGELRLTVQTDDGEPHEYLMESTGAQACHPNRVKVGRATKGRYWTMTLENVEGADFALDKLDIDWNTLSRRTR